MSGVFADIETATAGAALAALANCAADIGDASAVPAIFDAPYAEAMGIGGSAPQLTVLASDAPLAAYGDAVTIGTESYTITRVEPDGTGLLRLILESA